VIFFEAMRCAATGGVQLDGIGCAMWFVVRSWSVLRNSTQCGDLQDVL